MTVKQLHKSLEEWTVILRLRDWNISLEVVDDFESFGETRFDKYKNAKIVICSERTAPRNTPTCPDSEVTLVHELLHLHSAQLTMSIEPDSPEDNALEQMVEILAQSLVSLKRASSPIKHDDTRSCQIRPSGHAKKRRATGSRSR